MTYNDPRMTDAEEGPGCGTEVGVRDRDGQRWPGWTQPRRVTVHRPAVGEVWPGVQHASHRRPASTAATPVKPLKSWHDPRKVRNAKASDRTAFLRGRRGPNASPWPSRPKQLDAETPPRCHRKGAGKVPAFSRAAGSHGQRLSRRRRNGQQSELEEGYLAEPAGHPTYDVLATKLGNNLRQFLKAAGSLCKRLDAGNDIRLHVFLTIKKHNFSWILQNKAINVFPISCGVSHPLLVFSDSHGKPDALALPWVVFLKNDSSLHIGVRGDALPIDKNILEQSGYHHLTRAGVCVERETIKVSCYNDTFPKEY